MAMLVTVAGTLPCREKTDAMVRQAGRQNAGSA
jgi:hypothetical protein